MKTSKYIILILIIIFISSCSHNSEDKLIGKWVRYGDILQGMCIEIQNEGGSFKAEIISLPQNDSILYSGFYVGDIKWRDLRKIAPNKYEYVDLKKTLVPFSAPLCFTSDNGMARLEIVSDTIINTRLFAKGDEYVGTETHWKKLDENK